MKIAFFGAGLMGAGFARRALQNGHQVNVWNRDVSKAKALEASGARAFTRAAAAIDGVDRIDLSLADDASVNSVLEPLAGVIPASMWIVDHTTTAPTPTAERAARWAARGKVFLHAPVFMTPANAEAGTGMMLISGDPEKCAAVMPELQKMTAEICSRPGGKDIDAAGGLNQLGYPSDAGNHRIVPFLEIDFRPPWQLPRENTRAGDDRRQFVGQPIGAIRGPDQRTERANHVENLRDSALIKGVYVHAVPDESSRDIGLQVGDVRTRSGFRARIFGMSAEVKADTRGFSPGSRWPDHVARDTHDAPILAEEIERLHGFLGQANDPLWREHSFVELRDSVRTNANPWTLKVSGPAYDKSCARKMHRHVSDEWVVSADRDFIDRQCNQFARDRVSSGIVGCDADLVAQPSPVGVT